MIFWINFGRNPWRNCWRNRWGNSQRNSWRNPNNKLCWKFQLRLPGGTIGGSPGRIPQKKILQETPEGTGGYIPGGNLKKSLYGSWEESLYDFLNEFVQEFQEDPGTNHKRILEEFL